jgi:hypothetical protein
MTTRTSTATARIEDAFVQPWLHFILNLFCVVWLALSLDLRGVEIPSSADGTCPAVIGDQGPFIPGFAQVWVLTANIPQLGGLGPGIPFDGCQGARTRSQQNSQRFLDLIFRPVETQELFIAEKAPRKGERQYRFTHASWPEKKEPAPRSARLRQAQLATLQNRHQCSL